MTRTVMCPVKRLLDGLANENIEPEMSQQ